MTRLLALALAGLFAGVVACDEAPTTPEASSPTEAPAEISDVRGLSAIGGLLNSNAAFKNWKQGFNHGTDGWYGMETPGGLGWCGTIEQVARGNGDVLSSTGRAYAAVTQGTCNGLWNSPPPDGFGSGLVGAPWAPGPGFAALFNPMPADGYVMELDVYLDPAYEAVGPASGTFVFEAGSGPSLWEGAVIGYSASFFELSSGAFNYLWMPVWEGDGELLVDSYRVTEAGWYTFRFVFSDDAGSLAVDFELADRTGGTLFTRSMNSTYFGGAPVSGFDPANVATGYTWFTSVSRGLELPIDEYRVRRGN